MSLILNREMFSSEILRSRLIGLRTLKFRTLTGNPFKKLSRLQRSALQYATTEFLRDFPSSNLAFFYKSLKIYAALKCHLILLVSAKCM